MTTLTVKPKNKKELSKAKKMLKVLEISFEDNDDKPYDPAFVKKILEARKGPSIPYTDELRKELFGK